MDQRRPDGGMGAVAVIDGVCRDEAGAGALVLGRRLVHVRGPELRRRDDRLVYVEGAGPTNGNLSGLGGSAG